jgi:hypothetical protein
MSFIVVAYYTEGTFYEEHVPVLRESLERFEISHDIQVIPNQGSWLENTRYKPVFLQEMMLKHGEDIIYTDIDSEFMAYPVLFDEMPANVMIGVHLYQRGLYSPSRRQKEILSGTIFLKNHPEAMLILEAWRKECVQYPRVWDQRSLQKVLTKRGRFYALPAEYCVIFDVMESVECPVVVHYQASRRVRKNKGCLV